VSEKQQQLPETCITVSLTIHGNVMQQRDLDMVGL